MPLSKKDELRLRLADKRVKAWKEKMLEPVKVLTEKQKEAKARLYGLSAFGQDKPVVTYDDKATIECAASVRSMSDKLMRGFRRNGDNFSDYADRDAPAPAKAMPSPFVKPRAVSPFKRERKAPVIVRL